MRWEDEPYIKAYKRETPEWTLHPWEVRALHLYILKFMDRAGLLELGKSGMKALASLTRVPVEVLEACLPTWLDDGCLQLVPDGKGGQYLFSPSFLEAQEAKQTDAARKRAERERSSARARAAALGLLPASTGHVTSESNDPRWRPQPSNWPSFLDNLSRRVTPPSPCGRTRHTSSQKVTLNST